MVRKNVIKKSASVVIVMGILTSSLLGAFAGGKKPVATPIPTLPNITAEQIPESSFIPETLYPLTAPKKVLAQPQYNNGAHQEIVRQGINMVKRDYPSLAPRLNKLVVIYTDPRSGAQAKKSVADIIIDSSIVPDSIEVDYRSYAGPVSLPSYAGHFYDPASGLNYRGENNPTAYLRFNNHYYNAKWAANTKDAFEKLGYSLHYFGDLNAPHHAANVPAYVLTVTPNGSKTHTSYETWVDSNFRKCDSTNSWKGDYFCATSSFISIANYYSTQAKKQITKAMSSTDADKLSAMSNSLPYGKTGAAGMIYRFLIETKW